MIKETVELARSDSRPSNQYIVNNLLSEIIEFHGDGVSTDDQTMYTGIGKLTEQINVMFSAIRKGTTAQEKMKYNFSSPKPSAYRKALHIMQLSEKLGLPLITFITTSGADASIESEYQGQSRVIASCISQMGKMTVPTIAVFNGEGESGGALALANTKHILMLENSVFSVAAPEALFAILKQSKSEDNWDLLKNIPITSSQIFKAGLIEKVIPEKNLSKSKMINSLKDNIIDILD